MIEISKEVLNEIKRCAMDVSKKLGSNNLNDKRDDEEKERDTFRGFCAEYYVARKFKDNEWLKRLSNNSEPKGWDVVDRSGDDHIRYEVKNYIHSGTSGKHYAGKKTDYMEYPSFDYLALVSLENKHYDLNDESVKGYIYAIIPKTVYCKNRKTDGDKYYLTEDIINKYRK